MHIPDGFLDPKTWISSTLLSAGTVGYALRKTKQELEDRQIPFLGVMAAFIFAAQMVNFPIIGGTSGHLIGATLAAVLFGPWAATVIMTSILIIQSLLFQDGGITALGANVLNMAIVAVFTGYLTYKILNCALRAKHGAIQITVASWVSVMSATLAASFELALSGTAPLAIVLPAMLFWHAFIGVGEGAITVAVVAYLSRTRPELLADHVAGHQSKDRRISTAL